MAFNNAQNFSIHTVNLTNVQGAAYFNGLNPLTILLNAREIEATHTSRTASYAPKCKAGTRRLIVLDIMSWVRADLAGREGTWILWFTGPAGAGKTCIMREVVKECQKANLCVASYFFSAKITGLAHERPLVATLVHQLYTSIPEVKAPILQVISDNPGIFQESMEFQLEKLFVKVLEAYKNPTSSPTCSPSIVIVIDGFDECKSVQERGHILSVLRFIVEQLAFVVIVLASRPELDLRLEFGLPTLESITKFVYLQAYDGTEDIRNYYCDEFKRIRDTHPLKASIPENWPTEFVLNTLVDKANGHFVHPATIIKYVDNPRRNPLELLKEMMAISATDVAPILSQSANPFADLDSLYSLILHPPGADMSLLKDVLHTIASLNSVRNSRPARFYDQFLDLPLGTTTLALCDAHSIIHVPDSPNEPIRFHHKSLPDYLHRETRSRDLFRAAYDAHLDIFTRCTRHLQRWQTDPTNIEHYNAATDYASSHWASHLVSFLRARAPNSEIPHAILDSFDPRTTVRFNFVRCRLPNFPSSSSDCESIHHLIVRFIAHTSPPCLGIDFLSSP